MQTKESALESKSQLVVKILADDLNILHVNAFDIKGGAARAAYRIHQCLVENGIQNKIHSRMRVIEKYSTDQTVIGGLPQEKRAIWRRLQTRINARRCRGFKTENPVLHSPALLHTGLSSELINRRRIGDVDIIHLHWLGSNTLSIEEIGILPSPLVWTLHDQWPFCGAEHYTNPPLPSEEASSDERFSSGYKRANRPSHETGPDLNLLTWKRKKQTWHNPIEIVCTSTWLANCTRRSLLMKDWPITLIPCPINLHIWSPCDQGFARKLMKLPTNRTLILFGAIGGMTDYRKGSDLLLKALQILRCQLDESPITQLELVVFGQDKPDNQKVDLGFPIHFVGHLNDDHSLRALYAAADVMVVPSRQEAFGQTASEAQACGTPVVAFQSGGLTDIVDDKITGALAKPFDPASLAEAILWVLENPQRRYLLGKSARAKIEELCNPVKISKLYAEVYARANESAREQSQPSV